MKRRDIKRGLPTLHRLRYRGEVNVTESSVSQLHAVYEQRERLIQLLL